MRTSNDGTERELDRHCYPSYRCIHWLIPSDTARTGAGLTARQVNFAMFAVPCFAYLVVILVRHASLNVSQVNITVITVTTFLFSYLGDVFSLRSI